MTYIPRHKVTDLIPNKFEAIKIAAMEAAGITVSPSPAKLGQTLVEVLKR